MASPEQRRWFAEEIQPCEPALRAYLLRRFPSIPDHDDLIQDSYVRTLRAREQGRATVGRAYLFTTVRNAALDWLRRRRVTPLEALPADAEALALDPAPGLHEGIEHRQRLAAVAEAIVALPERCREVMLLRYVEELGTAEIAARLGIAPETVRVQLFKGAKTCMKFFEQAGLLDRPAEAVKP
jgi:RNA polymerase sigma-70 factor (ECF subfamily)